MKKYLIVYIICMNSVLFILFMYPNLLNKAYNKLGIVKIQSNHAYYRDSSWKFYANRSKTIHKESNQLVFLGNSITNGLAVESRFNAINFGVSGETIARAKKKVKELHNLENKRIVIAYGINDIPRNPVEVVADYQELINNLPNSATFYISSVLPINEKIYKRHRTKEKSNKQIHALNLMLKKLCDTDKRLFYMDTGGFLYNEVGELAEAFQTGDGLHLSRLGNEQWALGITWALDSVLDNQPTSSE